MKIQKSTIKIVFRFLTIFCSVFGTIICATYFATFKYDQLNDRISSLEKSTVTYSKQLQDIQNQVEKSNDAQDRSFVRFQLMVDAKLTRMEDKIEKTYEILALKHR